MKRTIYLNEEQLDNIIYIIDNVPERIKKHVDRGEKADAYVWQIVLDTAKDIEAKLNTDTSTINNIVEIGRRLK